MNEILYGRKEVLEGFGTLRTKVKVISDPDKTLMEPAQALVFVKMRVKDTEGNKMGSTGWVPLFPTDVDQANVFRATLKGLGFEFFDKAQIVLQPVEIAE